MDLWRLMSLDKFKELIQTKQLKFYPINLSELPPQGNSPQKVWQEYYELLAPILGREDKILWTIESFWRTLINSSFVSCWTTKNINNEHAWNRNANPDGIALKLNFEKVSSYISSLQHNILQGHVMYSNNPIYYPQLPNDINHPDVKRWANGIKKVHGSNSKEIPEIIKLLSGYEFLFRKRINYANEQEYRFVIMQSGNIDFNYWVDRIKHLSIKLETTPSYNNFYPQGPAHFSEMSRGEETPKSISIPFPFESVVEEIHFSPLASYRLAKEVYSIMAENLISFDLLHWNERIFR